MSRDELANKTPVRPPRVNKKIKPSPHKRPGLQDSLPPCKVPSQLNTLTPVGTAIIIVAEVK